MKLVNGHGADTIQLRRTVIPLGVGQKIIYTMTDGTYVGSLTQEATSADSLKLMAQDFSNYVAEITGGLLVPAASLPKVPADH